MFPITNSKEILSFPKMCSFLEYRWSTMRKHTLIDVLLSSISVSVSSKCPSSATFCRTIQKVPTSLRASNKPLSLTEVCEINAWHYIKRLYNVFVFFCLSYICVSFIVSFIPFRVINGCNLPSRLCSPALCDRRAYVGVIRSGTDCSVEGGDGYSMCCHAAFFWAAHFSMSLLKAFGSVCVCVCAQRSTLSVAAYTALNTQQHCGFFFYRSCSESALHSAASTTWPYNIQHKRHTRDT